MILDYKEYNYTVVTDDYVGRDGKRYVSIEFYEPYQEDEGDLVAFVSFSEVRARSGFYEGGITIGRERIGFLFSPDLIDDNLMRQVGIRGWMFLEPAVKLAFGKTRSNPSRRSRR